MAVEGRQVQPSNTEQDICWYVTGNGYYFVTANAVKRNLLGGGKYFGFG